MGGVDGEKQDRCIVARRRTATFAQAPAGWRYLGCLSCSRVKNAGPLGKRHKFRQGPNLHFLHDPVAMGLDGTLGATQRASDLFVDVAANDKLENFPLAWRQSPDTGAHAVQFALQSRSVWWRAKASSIARKRSSDATGLVRKSLAPALMAWTVAGMS